jgi:hypothetical protein
MHILEESEIISFAPTSQLHRPIALLDRAFMVVP